MNGKKCNALASVTMKNSSGILCWNAESYDIDGHNLVIKMMRRRAS